MKNFVLLIVLLTIAACSSPEERAAREAQRETDACTKAGYQPDTAAFEDCRLQVREQEEQRRADRVSAGEDSLPGHIGGSASPGVNIPLP